MADPRRVVLLARPGPASDKLQAALRAAGAEIVLVADPTAAGADEVLEASPDCVLVALEPAIEEALERFDSVLGDPAIMVIFDESELAGKREGWDEARWTRHLNAKLHGTEDVLPPGADSGEPDLMPLPGRPRAPEPRPSDLDIADYANEAERLAGTVPRDGGLDHAQREPEPEELSPTEAADSGDDDIESRQFRRDLEDLHLRIASMELVDDRMKASSQAKGLVLVLAGIGGPDAVRQLLGAMPEDFPRSVVVAQRLDGGRHDKLVKQMARATRLPVQLAEVGESPQPARVYVLPEDVGLASEDDVLRFVPGGVAGLISSLPADDSAVLFLSGSDGDLVNAAMAHSLHGALVAGQAPEGCYDATAPAALVARGAEAGSPTELARRLGARWPSH